MSEKTTAFFSDFLPNKLEGSDLGNGTFQFDIDGAGTWSVDLGEKAVSEGATEGADCVISTDVATWEGILDNPSSAIQAFMLGKLKATNIGLATKLQQILA